MVAPWREPGIFGPGLQFSADGHVHSENDLRSQFRVISPMFFAALGVPILSGRDFNDLDTQTKESVVIVSETLAKRMFPGQDAVGRHVYWTDPVLQFIPGFKAEQQRIIGVTAGFTMEKSVRRRTLRSTGPSTGHRRATVRTPIPRPYSLAFSSCKKKNLAHRRAGNRGF